jgi:hypothetical protein
LVSKMSTIANFPIVSTRRFSVRVAANELISPSNFSTSPPRLMVCRRNPRYMRK